VPAFKAIFPGFIEWLIVLCVVVYPIGYVAGVLHFKRLLFPVEQDILTESNPYSQEILSPIMVPMYKILPKLSKDSDVDPETIAHVEAILKATSVKRPTVAREEPWKRRIRRIKVLGLKITRLFTPRSLQWAQTQKAYMRWAETPLPDEYLKMVITRGEQFRDFVGICQGTLIDVGCGNGLFSGKTYEEVGYMPLKRGEYPIIGLDPLPQQAPIPWIDSFIQGKCEDPIPAKAKYATFITSFDHLEDPEKCLLSLKEAGVRHIFLWETLSRVKVGGDEAHLKRYTMDELMTIMKKTDFRSKRVQIISQTRDWFECFMEFEKIEG
jgi:hypothetical protein